MNDSRAIPDRIALVAGLAGVTMMLLFVVSNFVLGDFEPPKPTASGMDIAAHFLGNRSTLQWAVGMRYVVFVLLPVFAVGMAHRVGGTGELTRVLTTVGLMAMVWLLAIGTTANTFESILLFEGDRLSSQPELARMLSLGMNGLFSVAVLPHALIIGCFSEAGRRTKTLPLWLVLLGYFQMTTGLIGAIALTRALEMDMFFYLTGGVSFLAFALWYAMASVVLVVAGARGRQGS